jgi:hypothetical protein
MATPPPNVDPRAAVLFQTDKRLRRRRIVNRLMEALGTLASLLAVTVLVIVVASVVKNGWSAFSVEFFTTSPSSSGFGTAEGGILPSIVGSFLLVLIATIFALPIGVMVAIFISELAPRKLADAMARNASAVDRWGESWIFSPLAAAATGLCAMRSYHRSALLRTDNRAGTRLVRSRATRNRSAGLPRLSSSSTSLIGEIPYPYDHGFVPDKSMLRTLRVPMKCLARGKSLLDLTRIRQVFFATDTQTGAAGYDQLSFSN